MTWLHAALLWFAVGGSVAWFIDSTVLNRDMGDREELRPAIEVHNWVLWPVALALVAAGFVKGWRKT